MQNREYVGFHFFDYTYFIKRVTRMKVGRVYTNNNGESFSMSMKMKRLGKILMNLSACTPQSNGLSGKMDRTLLDKVRSMPV